MIEAVTAATAATVRLSQAIWTELGVPATLSKLVECGGVAPVRTNFTAKAAHA